MGFHIYCDFSKKVIHFTLSTSSLLNAIVLIFTACAMLILLVLCKNYLKNCQVVLIAANLSFFFSILGSPVKRKRSGSPGSSPMRSKFFHGHIMRREFGGIIVYQNCLIGITTSVSDQAIRTCPESWRPMISILLV